MNCPVCGKELEKGNVMSGGGACVFFMPEGEPLFQGVVLDATGIEERHGIILDGPYLTRFHTPSVPAHICRVCRKIVVEY